MKASKVGKTIAYIIGVIAAIAIAFLALWAVCLAGQFVFTTYGIGGLVLLCTILACCSMVGGNND